MHPASKMAVTFYDVAEPGDPAVASVAIGAFEQTEMELVRGPDGWALDWNLLPQWPEGREYATWPDALRVARATIQAQLATP
jgi:hypothetical protein